MSFSGRGKSSFTRKESTKEVKPSFLIVCEGERTEPNYFRQFSVSTLDIEVVGAGCDTVAVVDTAIDIITQATKKYDQVWCVFDKDSFPDERYRQAFVRARAKGIKIAYSNESFELWFVLHFQYLDSQINRKQYISVLARQLGSYKKNDATIYDQLRQYQSVAIRNARKLDEQYDSASLLEWPRTWVYKLVEELNKFKR